MLTIAFLVAVGSAMEHQITWYLAVDQFGYVTFANDLLKGTVFHHWGPIDALGPLLRPRTDMLAQTYIWDQGSIYSRYAPGFPMLLAVWLLVFGQSWAHFLNPTLFLFALVLVVGIQWTIARSLWRGSIAAGLIFLCPTFVHLWGLTLTRDMSAHVAGILAFWLLLVRYRPLSIRRVMAAGLCIGFAGSIRPDAVMYTIPATILLVWNWSRSLGGWQVLGRRAAWGLAGIVLGLLPSMTFYGVATGNPFVPTQAVELNRLFSRLTSPIVAPAVAAPAPVGATQASDRIGFPSPGWHGGTVSQVQGGGLRVAHLRDTLRGNWGKIRYGYGRVLVVIGVWGIIVGLVLRPMFTTAALAYVVTAILFFSMWTRPDSRYLIGVWLFLPMFIVEGLVGTLDVVRLLWRRQLHEVARGVAAAVAIGLLVAFALLGPGPNEWGRTDSPMETLTNLVVAWGTLAAIAAAIWPKRRVQVVLVPLLMVTTTVLAGLLAQHRIDRRASFQRPQAMRARLAFRQAVPSNAVVITSEDIGRPMENIEYYADRRAVYLTDLKRWKISVDRLARQLHSRDYVPYLLLERRRAAPMVDELRDKNFKPTLVADIPPSRNYDFLVAAPFHRGLPLQLWRIDWPAGDFLKAIHRQKKQAEAAATDRSP